MQKNVQRRSARVDLKNKRTSRSCKELVQNSFLTGEQHVREYIVSWVWDPRLADGSLKEVVLSPAETLLIRNHDGSTDKPQYVDATDLQMLVESARIRLAYVHDRQFAVSLSGIRHWYSFSSLG